MLVTQRAPTPIAGRRSNTVYMLPGTIQTARSIVAPVQPKTTASTTPPLYVATLAALWQSLSDAQRASWGVPTATTIGGYGWFVAAGTMALTYGLLPFEAPPPNSMQGSILFPWGYPEPDGIHTTLAVIWGSVVEPAGATYARVFKVASTTGGPDPIVTGAGYFFGSYGPLTWGYINLYDLTPALSAYSGRWWYPDSITAAPPEFSNPAVFEIFSYATGSDGWPGWGARYPFASQISTAQNVGPAYLGLWPPVPGPPYPWPTSDVFFATLGPVIRH